jgi:twitching motility two-component system response regulator PilG
MNLEGLKAMVIDDSATIARAGVNFLEGTAEEPTGIITKTSGDGFLALPIIREFMPDLIFLDVTMPQSNGFQICKLIKSLPQTKHIVVIMVTSKDSIFDKAKGIDAKADDYIPKPFTRKTIMSAVARHAPARFQTA